MEPLSNGKGPAVTLRRFAPIAVLILLGAAVHLVGLTDLPWPAGLDDLRAGLQDRIASAYAWALAAYMVAYAVAVALSFPATGLLTAAGGFLFGWQAGLAAALVGGTTGAGILFLAARSAAGDDVRRRLKGAGERLARGFEEDAFAYLLALRLAPVIPSFVVSVAAALFRVPAKTFLAATFIGRAPATAAYAVLGQGLDRVLADAAAAGRAPGFADLLTAEVAFALGGLSLLALVAVAARRLGVRRRP
jgi:uncharacterized membrane protein YdjX (TVP38/TMEM64 family)